MSQVSIVNDAKARGAVFDAGAPRSDVGSLAGISVLARISRAMQPGQRRGSFPPTMIMASVGSDFLLTPRPLILLLSGSVLCAAAFCLALFDLRFMTGTSAYWQAPRGLVHNGWADIATAVSGYESFVRDVWTLPLFQTSKLGVPAPVNVIFTDSIPVVAIYGRLLYRITGAVINPYGAWTVLCFIGSALTMTGLVAALGQRGLAAAIAAIAAGLCMPALLERWGHMSLMAQWEIPLAFIIYFRSRSAERAVWLVVSALLLAMLALWTHAYLFVMISSILAATLLQAIVDRRVRLFPAAAITIVFVVVLFFLTAMSGYFANQGPLDAEGFGAYSTNLLSPFFPQFSALFPIMGNLMIDATGLQYEGFCYLGTGMLVLIVATAPLLLRSIAEAWPRHACLMLLLAAFALFAISNQVYFGIWRVAFVPLPTSFMALASIFRASGRFIWPCMYLLTALAIAATPIAWGRAGAWLLVVAAVVQFVDTGPLRSALAAETAAPAWVPLDEARWVDALRQHKFLRVEPPYGCLSNPRGLAAQTALELQSLASRENVATNTVYAARHQEDCELLPPPSMPEGELRVYLLSDPHSSTPSDSVAACASSLVIAVCSRRIGNPAVSALVVANP